MIGVTVITLAYLAFMWVVFFKFKWLRLTPSWGVISGFFIIHLVLVPLIGVRFMSPITTDVRVVRHVVQLVPSLPQPTRVEQVLVKENTPVKKGDTLFVFDQTLYKAQVSAATAALAAAEQNVKIQEADIEIAKDSVARSQSDLDYALLQQARFTKLASQRAGSQESADEWTSRVSSAQAALDEAQEKQVRAELAYGSQIDGVSTSVIEAKAQLAEAKFYLEQTELKAPQDGVIVNLQVQEGMLSGVLRVGSIATLIMDKNPYLLAAYRPANLKNVKEGQSVVISLDNYPGKHFNGKVEEIWWASRRGQYNPSSALPLFPDLPVQPQIRLPVKITLDDPTVRMPIGGGGATLILASDSPFAWLGQISLRTHTWSRYVFPLPF